MTTSASRRADGLLVAALVYGAASLIHHVHNAVYLHSYPNLPQSLSVTRVLAEWAATALVGVVGYLLWQRGRGVAGLAVLAFYAALGLLGLAHYGLAPFSAHSLAMNATIGFEVATAFCLLAVVVRNFLEVARSAPDSPRRRVPF